MPSFTPYPKLQFADAYSAPSDGYYGRRLSVMFDSTNIYETTDGYFSDSGMSTKIPVLLNVYGETSEINLDGYETFAFDKPGNNVIGNLHFTTFTDIKFLPSNKIQIADAYGVVEVTEALPINYFDDGYDTPYTKFTNYGNGIFLFNTALKKLDGYNQVSINTAKNDGYFTFNNLDGYSDIDLGFGKFVFNYSGPFKAPIITPPKKIYIGNSIELLNAADGVMDEIKITSATATKTRTRKLNGSYDISVDATSPVFNEPDAKTLTLLHMDDNYKSIINAIRDPLDSLNLSDSILANIVSLRSDRTLFINYVNSLNISGSIVEGVADTRPLSEQLFDLVTVLNVTNDSSGYYKLSGNYFPSEITVNNNFKHAAIFSDENFFIEKAGLINNNEGTIEVWIAPLFNLLGDFNRRVYFDSIEHAIIGKNGQLISTNANLIKLPNNIIARQINSVRLFNGDEFDFIDGAILSQDGKTIVLSRELPSNETAIIIDYIPLTASNDRLSLFKNESGDLVFAISAGGILYQTSKNISEWQKNEWHRIMVTWKTNDRNSLDHLNMYVDGTKIAIIKYGEGYLFNTFLFKQEAQVTISSKIIPQNIKFNGSLDRLYIGADYSGNKNAMCRMSNLRVSYIERQPITDSAGNFIDSDFNGGSKSATPEISDAFTSYLEDFDPKNKFIVNFATIQDSTAGAHDLHVTVRDSFNLVRGVGDGKVERLLRELLKVIKPAEARLKISIEDVDS